MATDTATQTTAQTETNAWQYGVVAGVVAAIVMGGLMAMQMRPVLEVAIPSMYFLTGGFAGFTIHVAHGAVLGVVFAAIASTQADLTIAKSTALGVGYGVVLWIVLAVLVMPIWLSVVGSPANPPLPNVSVMSLVGHVVYGVVLGGAYAALR
ncbi:histidine kinase [Halobellus sp. Atlit-38R]|uniref:histidine kinase n=1 Tax=Halobellus sp. Atlit-38R TaxID=2282131 RepID=UPI000EF1F023|nr:histidine kinase [Halobellus sp. Atlit-38R]RLM91019.1 histidine kinase [Halobellus sp. Atlit-38R]